jgi:hypothetical protein
MTKIAKKFFRKNLAEENKNIKDKGIISATEVAGFIVCPEAWRLQRTTDILKGDTSISTEGIELHKAWAASVEEAHHLIIGIRVILYLLAVAVVIIAFKLQG